MSDGEWLDTEQLADWLDVPTATVRQWRHKGTGPVAHKLGRHVRYRRADVDAWITENRDTAAR